ncbi:MAG: ABC transporter ATP-binding protein [Gammaproteobacteria bacterium]|nr:ABC transporter ATP-binding protein [Gammaproteobacteria bacterium]
MASGNSILQIDDINLAFGGVTALNGISFDVAEGEICAVIGPNGAGKSSMLNVINGVYVPQSGRVIFRGQDCTQMRPRQIAKLGMARTFQNIGLFQGMTVLENILTGRSLKIRSTWIEQGLNIGRARREEVENRALVEEVIEFLHLQSIRKTPVGKLPYGLQKRVELARALVAEPTLLLQDEPMTGMNLEEKKDMSCFALEINREYGTTIVLIEHDMSVVMDISDHVVVLDYGAKIGDGTPDEVKNNQEVIDAYLGVTH